MLTEIIGESLILFACTPTKEKVKASKLVVQILIRAVIWIFYFVIGYILSFEIANSGSIKFLGYLLMSMSMFFLIRTSYVSIHNQIKKH